LDFIPADADAGRDVMNLRLLWLAVTFSNLVLADGGTILFHKTAGDFDVTVFSKSEAVRAGSNDLSVVVQRRDNTTVMDATVLLRLERVQGDGQIMRLTSIATHAKATNKTLYAATVNIPSTGQWRLDADVTGGGKNGIATGEINVLAPQPPMQSYWPFVAMVPLLGIAFIVNRKLRQRFRARSR
jgi:hypothetical protein